MYSKRPVETGRGWENDDISARAGPVCVDKAFFHPPKVGDLGGAIERFPPILFGSGEGEGGGGEEEIPPIFQRK